MTTILEGIFKGLLEWLYGLILEIVEYLANGLLSVFSMDLNYFYEAIPITSEIVNIIIASAWAFLLGNMVFQASKSMISAIGVEGQDPTQLFMRTFLFGFLLLASRQVCEIGLGMSSTIIEMLQVPSSVDVSLPDEDIFGINASWLLMIIIGVVVMWQMVKLFFEVGERYFLVGFLTLAAPWAFSMGGSRNTEDIFKGWVRMYASMCLMMVLNVIFLKMFLSAMGSMPDDGGIIAWAIFVIAICRVARKIDVIIMRIGLNPAPTGQEIGKGFVGKMASYVVMRNIVGGAAAALGGATGGAAKAATGGGAKPPPFGSHGSHTNSRNSSSSHTGTAGRGANSPSAPGGSSNSYTGSNSQQTASSQSTSAHTGTAGTGKAGGVNSASNSYEGATMYSGAEGGTPQDTAGTAFSQTNTSHGTAGNVGEQRPVGTHYRPDTDRNSVTQHREDTQSNSRRTSVSGSMGGHRPGTAGMPGIAGMGKGFIPDVGGNNAASAHKADMAGTELHGISSLHKMPGTSGKLSGTAGNQQSGQARPSRYSAATAGLHGTAGISQSASSARRSSIDSRGDIKSGSASEQGSASSRMPPSYKLAQQMPKGTHGNNAPATDKRRSMVSENAIAKPTQPKKVNTQSSDSPSRYSRNADRQPTAGVTGQTSSHIRHSRNAVLNDDGVQGAAGGIRHGRNAAHDSNQRQGGNISFTPTGTNYNAARRGGGSSSQDTVRRTSSKPTPGTAGMQPKKHDSFAEKTGVVGKGSVPLGKNHSIIHKSNPGQSDARRTNRNGGGNSV